MEEFLGLAISAVGIKLTNKKVVPVPKSKTDLQAFIGQINEPLHILLYKGVLWKW